jgi:hypothetical protein
VGKSKIEKYVVHGIHYEANKDQDALTVWWARVPWGTYERFGTWREAAAYLTMRHHLKSGRKPYRQDRNDPGRTTLGA